VGIVYTQHRTFLFLLFNFNYSVWSRGPQWSINNKPYRWLGIVIVILFITIFMYTSIYIIIEQYFNEYGKKKKFFPIFMSQLYQLIDIIRYIRNLKQRNGWFLWVCYHISYIVWDTRTLLYYVAKLNICMSNYLLFTYKITLGS